LKITSTKIEARGKQAPEPGSASNRLMSAVLCHLAEAPAFAHAKPATSRTSQHIVFKPLIALESPDTAR
jgi:hypothetical protein